MDLDEWINDPPSESEDDDEDIFKSDIFVKNQNSATNHRNEKVPAYEPTEEELQKVKLKLYFNLVLFKKLQVILKFKI